MTPTWSHRVASPVGSRSVQLAGAAVAAATAELVAVARERAASRFEAHVADVVLDTESGRFHVAGTPTRRVEWADLVDSTGSPDGGPLAAEHAFEPQMPTFPFGTHVAVVDVDTETGHVRLSRRVAVDDAGTFVNPLLAEGQIHGGIAQGVGPGAARGGPLRRRRPAEDHQLRRLPSDLGSRTAVVRARADGDADVRQRTGGEGGRRVGDDRARSRPCTTRSSTPSPIWVSGTWRRPSPRSGSGAPSTLNLRVPDIQSGHAWVRCGLRRS